MSVKANPMENLSPTMWRTIQHLRKNKTIRVDRVSTGWTYYCGSFILNMARAGNRHKIPVQTYQGLMLRGIIEQQRVEGTRIYYRIKPEFLVDD